MNYSPSRLGKLKLCPKFDYKPVDPDDPNAAANKGTLLHEAYATGNMAGLTQEEQDAINCALLQTDGFKVNLPQPAETFSEIRLRYSPLDLVGTADKVLIGGDQAVVLDLKTGPSGLPDDADDSEQLLSYILGVYEKYPGVQSCNGMLLNPFTRETGELIMTTRDMVPALHARIEETIKRREDPFSEPTPGSHCSDCAHVTRCWALVPTVREAGQALWPLLPAEMNPAATDLDPVVRGIRAVLRKVLEAWCESVREADNESGVTPPGWKRITKSGTPTLAKESRVDAYKKLEALGLSTDELFACSRPTLGDIVEQVALHKDLPKEEAKSLVYETLKGLLSAESTSYLMRDKKSLSDADIARLFREKGGTGRINGPQA